MDGEDFAPGYFQVYCEGAASPGRFRLESAAGRPDAGGTVGRDRVRDGEGLDRLARAMIDRDPPHFTLLRLEGAGQHVREGEDFRLHLKTRGRYGFAVFMDAVVVPR